MYHEQNRIFYSAWNHSGRFLVNLHYNIYTSLHNLYNYTVIQFLQALRVSPLNKCISNIILFTYSGFYLNILLTVEPTEEETGTETFESVFIR